MTAAGNLVVLAAGGTAGHMFPAEALAVELGRRGRRLTLFTDRRGGAYGGPLGEIDTRRIRAGGIAGKGLPGRAGGVIELALGTVQARGLLAKLKPAAVIGFGGYASVPTMMAASLAGLPTAIHEQNAVLGRANRLLARRVRRIATAFAAPGGVPGDCRSKLVHTGMPVRASVLAMRARDYAAPAAGGTVEILVFGGSLGANIFSRVVPAALGGLAGDLKRRLRVTQQCRPEDLDGVRAAYAGLGIDATLESFFTDMPERLAAAHIVVARAGASTVAEIMAVGRPAILVPYPHAVDDHQAFNAQALADAGGGWVVPEPHFTADALARRLTEILAAPEMLGIAAAAARAAGQSNAAARLADVVEALMPANGDHAPRRAAA
jgi:UDP-N-acetylglucosamine--N-acetylmuramyl-(pentapeptide) pyrophosphoryl-undecaprenol N-acetylglucosamine transferase